MAFDVNDLRRQRTAAATNMQSCAAALDTAETAEAPDTAAIEAATAAFSTAQAEFDALNVRVQRAETVEAATAAAAVPVDMPSGLAGGSALSPATPKNPMEKGVGAGLFIMALAAGSGDAARAATYAENHGHSTISAALSGATDAAGGVTVPQELSGEIIEMLKPRVTVRNAGARVIDMPAGQVTDARQTGGATAGYGAENAPAVESEPGFDRVDKSFKTLRSLVPVGNALLRHASVAVAMMVRDDMLDVMALREDLAFLRADGTGDQPTGLKTWCPGANVIVAADAVFANVDLYLRQCEAKLTDANIPMAKPGWIMRGGVKSFLAGLRDANGNLAYPSIDASNTLRGYPIYTTSQIPNNLGVGSDESEITLADFNEILIGDSMKLTLASSGEATYVDTNGDTISAFQRDLTLMRAIAEHDLAPRHVEAIAMITTKGWG